ncbi:hypothetical protein QF000_005077 [Paraburkholderia atlantica]|uniref:Uncharacterized protein n=1 Tax=Paraburkholderia atlantica TaxID=2654982 RepID=A0A7W8QCT1_PARAM|nr:hypothetical protein [Paraburkholderia atlantica]MBB5427906.1 hypothetical protein [Paraburkholderia atlantica]
MLPIRCRPDASVPLADRNCYIDFCFTFRIAAPARGRGCVILR